MGRYFYHFYTEFIRPCEAPKDRIFTGFGNKKFPTDSYFSSNVDFCLQEKNTFLRYFSCLWTFWDRKVYSRVEW